MADGFLTPSISISSAVEGLTLLNPNINTVPIVIGILIVLFVFQQFGTNVIGKTFGPVMTLWFVVIGIFGTAPNYPISFSP
jgi:KUP system potassium uptake protein